MFKSKINLVRSSFFQQKKLSLYFFLLTIILIAVPTIDLFVNIPEKDYIITLTGIWGICLALLEKNIRFTFNNIDKLIILFICYQIIHLIFLSQSNLFEIGIWIRISFVCMYFFLRIMYSIYKENIFKMLAFLLGLKVFIELSVGLLQYIGWVKESKTEFFKVVGTYTSPNFFAYTLVLGLLICVWYIFYNYKTLSLFKKYMAYLYIGLNILLLTGTKSRAALLGFVVCVIIFLVKTKKITFNKNNLKIKILGAVTLILFCFVGGKKLYNYKKESADGRALVAKITLNEIKDKPFLGHGLLYFEKGYNTAKANYFKEAPREWNEVKVADYVLTAMNDYLQITYEVGFIGLLLLLLIFILPFIKNSNSDYSILGTLIFSFMAIIALFSSIHRHEGLVIYGILGFFMAQHKIGKEEEKISNKKNLFLKIVLIFLSTVFITIGILRSYAEHFIITNLKKQESISKPSPKDWEKWTYIFSNNGLSSFGYGKVMYRNYSMKEEGLKVMAESLLKNSKPKNVRSLAYYYLELEYYEKARELFELNTYTQPFRFEPKMDLIQYYLKIGDENLVCEKAQEVIDFSVKIPSKKITKYKNICESLLEKENCN